MRPVSNDPADVLPLQELISKARRGPPLLMVVAGSGLVTHSAVESGADALMVLNAGMYRTLGTGSLASFLPYGNANDQTDHLLRRHVLPRADGLPVIAGVFALDPTRPVGDVLRRMQDLGVQGIINWPAVGYLDGRFREAMEEEGLGTSLEVEMFELAREMGFVTFAFAFATEEVERFVSAGVDALIFNVGLTRASGDVRAKRDQLHQAISLLNRLSQAASGNRDCLRMVFGGSITAPEDLREVFRHTSIQGFAGGSVFERLPVREIVSSTIRRFKGVARSQRPDAAGSLGGLVGASPAMERVFELVRRIAPQDVTVCIEGESGTGKELVATQLHRLSPRANQPLVTLNCGAIPDSLLESEFFGHERGAFTGAERRRLGKFELAHGGTLVLDEIADLSLHGQVALLRVLQERELVRVGGDATVPVDVRVLAASNRSLAALVAAGEFRADLYYRLSAITLQIPPLRERLEDIPQLVEGILVELQARMGRELAGLSSRYENKLRRHAWPGNVRELEQVIYRSAILEDGPILEGWQFTPSPDLPREGLPRPGRSPSNRERAEQALWEAGGNKARAARTLNVTRKTFYRWLNGE